MWWKGLLTVVGRPPPFVLFRQADGRSKRNRHDRLRVQYGEGERMIMKPWLVCCAAIAALAVLSRAPSAQSADHEASVPLSPSEAAGAWSLESAGRDICVVTLGKTPVGAGYAAKVGAGCAGALPGDPVAWKPTADGMQLVGADGRTVIGFGRWSNSLLVSHQASGVDIQLKRGAARDVAH